MAKNSKDISKKGEGVILTPAPRLPLTIVLLGLFLLPLPLSPWPTVVISGFGLALLFQAFTLRLEFTKTDMIVWQLDRELRRFPFKDWLAWRIFLPWLPGILYFREIQSPHLLPILFDLEQLREQLKLKVGNLEKPKKAILSNKN